MNLHIQTSSDKTHIRLTPNDLEPKVLKPADIEQFISLLAKCREALFPLVSQTQPHNHDGDLLIDGFDPMFHVSKLDHSHDVLMLSIGFQGLGWRTAALSVEDARCLANTLLQAINKTEE